MNLKTWIDYRKKRLWLVVALMLFLGLVALVTKISVQKSDFGTNEEILTKPNVSQAYYDIKHSPRWQDSNIPQTNGNGGWSGYVCSAQGQCENGDFKSCSWECPDPPGGTCHCDFDPYACTCTCTQCQ